ncbi:putative ubiquitin-specific processing protease 21 [Gigaspora margarita]|uniref:Putative ubiquitin-specific processing protease 21 n=1 Tax=Gigaspora margarita TaxID=4874 RepID=A0A8H4AZ36_GIGMA|nr:putative ubiquitin-specific processing protease 21 [Gigaspora margarita]
MASKQNELKLFLEVAYRPINDKSWFPPIEKEILIYVRDIIPILCKKKEYPPYTPLKIYEEIKPKMIEKLDPNLTFQQSEIDYGDIICFRKVLTDKIIFYAPTTEVRIHDIPVFYELLYMRIVIQFRPKYKYPDPKPEFELVLNKLYTYNDCLVGEFHHL